MNEYVIGNTSGFGYVVGTERTRREVSQRGLASMSEVSRSFVAAIEADGKDITLSKALRIINSLGCEVVIRRKGEKRERQ